jgi:CTP synthase (UTP-ammonia lyase)
VIEALDASSIYSVPLQYHAEGLDEQVLLHFGLESANPTSRAGPTSSTATRTRKAR